MRKKVLVLGGNFGGLTAALAVHHELGGDVDVTVVSKDDHFLFNPSLIWLPFGKRERADITFPIGPVLADHGVELVHEAATSLDPVARRVVTESGKVLDYDYVVIATGYRNKDDVAPGFKENAVTITTLPEAERAGAAWRRFLDDPGDVVVAASQGAGCFGAAYEFLFNTAHQLKKAGLDKQVKLTYVTSEPFLGHFGIGGLPHGEQLLGMFLRKQGIDAKISVGIDTVEDGALMLADGSQVPFSYAMVVPPFVGQDFPQAGRRPRRRQGLHRGPRHLPDRQVRRRVRRRRRGRRRRALADADPCGDPEDRLPDRGDGARGGLQHRRPGPRRGAAGAQVVR